MNFILSRDKAITIPPAATKLSGIPDNAKLELTTLDGAVILTKSKMTTMEYVKLLTALTAHVGQKSYGLTPEEAAVQFFKYCADPKTQDHAIKLLKRWKEEQEVQERNSTNAK